MTAAVKAYYQDTDAVQRETWLDTGLEWTCSNSTAEWFACLSRKNGMIMVDLYWDHDGLRRRWPLEYLHRPRPRFSLLGFSTCTRISDNVEVDGYEFMFNSKDSVIICKSDASFILDVQPLPLELLSNYVSDVYYACYFALVSFRLPAEVARLAAEFVH
jgi:hypothetical protein